MKRSVLSAIKTVRYAYDAVSYPDRERAFFSSRKGSLKGKPVLVVGNGPSLNQTPLDLFVGVPGIGMNKIDLLFNRSPWRPNYVVCSNDVVVMQHADVFAKSEIPILLPWKSRWSAKRRNRNVHFFRNTNQGDFTEDFAGPVPIGCTVTQIALQWAFYLEADPVIIFGVDHSFVFKGEKQSYVRWQGADVNHFDPNYFKNGSLFGNPNLEESERIYAIAHDSFRRVGRRVFDATVGGKLEVFPKIGVEDAMRLTRV